MSEFHHQMYVIIDGFSMDDLIDKLIFKTNIECTKFVTENFTHLHNTAENMFVYNVPHSTFKSLFLNIKSLEILLNSEGTIGWLDDLIFTFFATVLIFSVEYDIKNNN